jgi:hypothetical protein
LRTQDAAIVRHLLGALQALRTTEQASRENANGDERALVRPVKGRRFTQPWLAKLGDSLEGRRRWR